MFQKLRRLRTFEQQNFPSLQSVLDRVLVAEIGLYAERGRPLTIKGLLLLNLGAPATVRRRLKRLVGLGIIRKRPVSHDKRICNLEVDSSMRMAIAKYLKVISRL